MALSRGADLRGTGIVWLGKDLRYCVVQPLTKEVANPVSIQILIDATCKFPFAS